MLIRVAELERFAAQLLTAAGARPRESEVVASSLIDANLCGHDSHGVVRVLEYAEQIKAGELIPGAPLEIVAETPSILVGDAKFGFGQVQCARVIDRLLPKARDQGTATGAVRNCGHVGRLGEWAERIAAEGLAGLLTVNDNGVLRCVAPPGGIEPCISTNPLAIAVPCKARLPLVLDMSTSAVANGKIRVAQLAGESCPEGWLQDAEGNPTNDPAARFAAERPATILPLGGPQAYKGFGLGLLLDLLVGGLSGGRCPPAAAGTPQANNVLVAIWDPARFAGESHFESEARKLVGFVRSSARKPGVKAIRLPGDRAQALRAQRRATGIPLDSGTWKALVALGGAYGVGVPRQA